MKVFVQIVLGISLLLPLSAANAQQVVRSFTGPGFDIPAGSALTGSIIDLPVFEKPVTNVRVHLKDVTGDGLYLALVRWRPDGTMDKIHLTNWGKCAARNADATFSANGAYHNSYCPKGLDRDWQPHESFDAFRGLNAAGRWRLENFYAVKTSSIGSWELEIEFEQELTFSWEPGPWGEWSNTCGEAARSRELVCMGNDGSAYGDLPCQGEPKPETHETAYITSGCGYSWEPGRWIPEPACGATSENRSLACRRSDDVLVSVDQCDAETKPDTARTGSAYDHSTCTYEITVGPWSETEYSCGYARRTRDVLCLRSDGHILTDVVVCGAERLPASSEGVEDYSSCGYTWDQKGFDYSACSSGSLTWTPLYSCLRSNGAYVAGSFCSDIALPSGPETLSCDEVGSFDPMPHDDPANPWPEFEYDEESGVTVGEGLPPSEAVPPSPVDDDREGTPYTAGTYDPETGEYTTADGEVLTDGQYDFATNTYWYTGDLEKIIIMRRVLN